MSTATVSGTSGEDRSDYTRDESRSIRQRSLRLLGSLVSPLRWQLVLAGAVLIVSTALRVAGPALIAFGIDNALPAVIERSDWMPTIGVVGVYMPQDPGAATEGAKEGRIGWDYGTFFTKGQSMGTGQAPVMRYNRQLRDLIVAGRATPGFIVSHELGLDRALEGYRNFDDRVDGWTKVLLHPAS